MINFSSTQLVENISLSNINICGQNTLVPLLNGEKKRFINLDNDGNTSLHGYIPFLCNSLDRTIWPSVIYPVKSGIGCVMSSPIIVNIGICVTEPFRPFITPALSYIVAKSVYM